MVDEAEPEYASEEVAAAARKQLEDLTKSMEMNAGKLNCRTAALGRNYHLPCIRKP